MAGPVKLLKGPRCPDTTHTHTNITNLSSFTLTALQEEVLERGLTFIPTPAREDRKELRRDLYKYHRRLRILDYFEHQMKDDYLPFIEPSNWIPPLEEASDHIQDLIQKDIRAFKALRTRPPLRGNLSTQHRGALRSLKLNQHIVIKPADKGSQIVIMNKNNYLLEAHKQLNNRLHYTPLTEPIQNLTKKLIQDILDKLLLDRFISAKQYNYLLGSETPRARQFYLLPKIHKAPEKWTVPYRVPPGRPIVSDCGSESYRVAEFIDFHINPLSQRHDSYVRDTYDFVEKVRMITAPREAFLFSIDITSLYTNIDTHLGLRAVGRAFHRYPDPARPDGAILDLLELSLTRNDFEFNGKYFLQVHGTAMGKKFAPAYANLYMCMWEETAFQKCPNKPLLYLRYLDDIFGVWGNSREEFEVFLNILNTHHPAISITHNIQEKEIEFLDTTVFFTPQPPGHKTLGTKVYFKETDRHALLHKSSYHPKHTFKGIIKSQLIRFHRICTHQADTEQATNSLFTALTPRGYSKRFLRGIRQEVKTLFAEGQTYKKEKDDRNIIPFVCTFSQAGVRLGSRVKSHFQQAGELEQAWGNFKVISAYRRNKNLKDMLVHSKMREKVSPLQEYFTYLKFISNPRAGTSSPIDGPMTLLTANIVYGIRCRKCQVLYIGETGKALETRLKQHIYHIKKGNQTCLLYTHYIQHTLENLQIFGVESNFNWSSTKRKYTENKWIRQLKTIEPQGLNMK